MYKIEEGKIESRMAKMNSLGEHKSSVNCFFILFSQDWYKANSKYSILSASSSFLFHKISTELTQNI